MTRRACVAWDLDPLTDGHLAALAALAADHDELIVAVTHASDAYTAAHPLPAGERIARAAAALRPALPRPLLLLPIPRGALTDAQFATRIRLYSPPFHTFLCHTDDEAATRAAVLGCEIRRAPPPTGAPFAPPAAALARRRGLFITRAQFFHIGHRAFVRQILAERDEVIVLVSMANRSHTVDNPATAGERVEMIAPLLAAEAPGRHHLAAAPYLDDDAANFPELRLLLPPFDAVYTNSPSTAAMADVPVFSLREPLAASGTDLRRRILAGEPYDHLLPPEVAHVLAHSPALPRLRALARPEAR